MQQRSVEACAQVVRTAKSATVLAGRGGGCGIVEFLYQDAERERSARYLTVNKVTGRDARSSCELEG